MKIKATVNMPRMKAKLNKLSKEFGDTHEQAVVRLMVSAARNLAFETEAWGKVGTKKKQEIAIMRGITNVVNIVTPKHLQSLKKKGAVTVIESGSDLSEYVNGLRGKDGMTARMTKDMRAYTSEAVVKQCFTIRRKLAGIAKGGWLGAGMKASQMQTGGEKISIGKNFLSYAQKFARFGKVAMRGGILTKRFGILYNTAKHAGKKRVLTNTGIETAKNQASIAVVKWYKAAIKSRKAKLTV